MIAACDDFAADLVAYLDAELGAADRVRIEAHLGTCLACRREVEQLRRLRTLIDGVRPLELSSDFHDRMWRRLDSLPSGATRRRRMRAVLWAAPALAAAAALALVSYSSIARLRGAATSAPGSRSVAAAPRQHDTQERAVASSGREPQPGAPGDVAKADDVAEYPPDLVEHPELFLRLPVVRRLQKLEHFEEVRQHQDEEPVGLAPGSAAVG